MAWPRAALRVLVVLAVGLFALGGVLGGSAARRARNSPLPDDPGLDVRLDLNNATPEELESLPGVGKVLAGRIVAHREQRGPFCCVDGLAQVPGCGLKLVAAVRPLVTVR